MTPVNADTGEILSCSPDEARSITDRIKVAVEATWHLIAEAYQRGAWKALGYSSWDDYCTREFGTSRLRLPREERADTVQSLRDAGLSIRAIEAATGVTAKTIRKDIKQVREIPTPAKPLERETVTPNFKKSAQGTAAQATPAAPVPDPGTAKVKGIDGKQYAATSKREPRRTPLVDTAQQLGWEIRRAAEKLDRLSHDDRFNGNKEEVAARLRGHLEFCVEVCQDLLDAFTTNNQEK